MHSEKPKTIVNCSQPTIQNEIQPLLGLWNFCRRFVPGYATFVSPFTDLLRGKDKDFNWED
jgi:hypothetical protein